MLIKLLEFASLFLIGLFILTQLLIPSLQGRLLFPFFQKTAVIEDELNHAHQELHDVHLSQEVAKTKEEVAAEEAKLAKLKKKAGV